MTAPHTARTCQHADCDGRTVARRLCRNHYQQAWKAGTLDIAPRLPRPPAPRVCPDEHKHDASTTCYIQHQCRCNPCRDNRADRERTRKRLTAYGRFNTGLVDAHPVRDHLLLLADFGLGYKRVAALAGIGITPTRNILWGRQDPGPRRGELPKRVRRETAAALLAVKPTLENLADGALIPARGTHRRIQALVARGWSISRLARRLGVNGSHFSRMMRSDRVTVRVHRATAQLFDELWQQLPPHTLWHDAAAYTRAVRYAEERRWLPPLAWDDVDTDPEPPVADEEADTVDDIAVELAVGGERVRLTRAERIAAILRLVELGFTDQDIARRMGISDKTALRTRQEQGVTSPFTAKDGAA